MLREPRNHASSRNLASHCVLTAVGSFLVLSGLFAAYVAFPALVDWQIDLNYDLANEDSEGFKAFVSATFYIFSPFSGHHTICPISTVALPHCATSNS